MSHSSQLLSVLILLGVMLFASCEPPRQVADSGFDTKVAHPAYTDTRPKVLFDEAHKNIHTAVGLAGTLAPSGGGVRSLVLSAASLGFVRRDRRVRRLIFVFDQDREELRRLRLARVG